MNDQPILVLFLEETATSLRIELKDIRVEYGSRVPQSKTHLVEEAYDEECFE